MASARHGTTWPRQWPTDSVQVATCVLASARDSVRGPALPRADPAQVPHDCSPRPRAAPTLATPARKTKTRPDPARAGEQCLSFIPFAQGPERGDPENPTPMATQVRRPGPHAALPASPRVGCPRPFQRCSAGARRCSAAAQPASAAMARPHPATCSLVRRHACRWSAWPVGCCAGRGSWLLRAAAGRQAATPAAAGQAAGCSSSARCRLQWCSAKLVSLTPHKYTSPLHLLNLSSLSRSDCVVLNADTCLCDPCAHSPAFQHWKPRFRMRRHERCARGSHTTSIHP
jgi:hypothetical protein